MAEQQKKLTDFEVMFDVCTIMRQHFVIKEVSTENKLMDDLGADSLDKIELSMMVEEHFGFELSIDAFNEVVTVQDVIDVVRKELE